MANYTIFSYDYRTNEYGWVGTQADKDPSSFVDLLDAPKDSLAPAYVDVVLQLPPTFLRGQKVKAKYLVGSKYPAWYWVENTLGIVVEDYDGPVEPSDG